MNLDAGLAALLSGAFLLGILHALEPGHGKSIVGSYLIAAHGAVRHAILLGVVVTLTHTLVVYILAAMTLGLADRIPPERTEHWMELISATLLLGVGLWLLRQAFGSSAGHGHAHTHELAHDHGYDHGHGHEHADTHEHADEHGHPHAAGEEHRHAPGPGGGAAPAMSPPRDPLSLWSILAVGASGGLVPCPAAIAALLLAINQRRLAAGIAVVAALSLGVACTLVAVGILFVKARDWASSRLGSDRLATVLPRVSAVIVSLLGSSLFVRALLGHSH
ncbi:MAG: sulfite exporter TauE/SafE family protein [Planctomycetes bacterium]|nr:sulfite exporter TauE/SafE family protein [Planctomycetota bacterium]